MPCVPCVPCVPVSCVLENARVTYGRHCGTLDSVRMELEAASEELEVRLAATTTVSEPLGRLAAVPAPTDRLVDAGVSYDDGLALAMVEAAYWSPTEVMLIDELSTVRAGNAALSALADSLRARLALSE